MIVALLIMIAATAVTGMANLAAELGTGPLSGVLAKVERPPRVAGVSNWCGSRCMNRWPTSRSCCTSSASPSRALPIAKIWCVR
jgi:hypothetical protein